MRILTTLCLAAAASASSASAEPAVTPYPQSMADGARRIAAKDFAGAVLAFRAALDARPLDGRALSELSWASFLAGDFAAAEVSASKASWAAKDPQLRAMAFYNLGRADEALGRLSAAQVAYSRSLDLRDNPEVRGHLKGLGAALLTPHSLAGPFGAPDEFCKRPCEVVPDIDQQVDKSGEAIVDLAGNAQHDAKPPFVSVAKIITEAPDPDRSYPIANLAIQVGASWYVLPDVGQAPRGHGGSHAIDIAMVGPRLVATWTANIGRFGHVDELATIVCGVGASQRPSCVGPIISDWSETVDHCIKAENCTTRPTFIAGFHCLAQLRGDVLQLTRSPWKLNNYDEGIQVGPRADACEALPTFGKHTLVF
jgi:tetratricopeptide (TPR) repeat protein